MTGIKLMENHRPYAACSGGLLGVGAFYGAERRGHGEYFSDVLLTNDTDNTHFSSTFSFHAKYSLTAASPRMSASLP